MPIPFSPYRFTCLCCGWSKRYVPSCDVIDQNDMPTNCPACGKACLKFKIEPSPFRYHRQVDPALTPITPFGLLRSLLRLFKK